MQVLFIQGGVQMIVAEVMPARPIALPYPAPPAALCPARQTLRSDHPWTLCAQVVVAVLLAVQFNAHSGQAIDKTIGTVVIVFICLFIAGFGWSWGPLVRLPLP